ncbi:hypothetical protein TWF718_010724 [Orbilia javanica]|uniref:Uncharacterized protein n=1 Tax=Orbilia javanica TaxID=47235 RepID=A0AAN8RET0_9PEZI
MTSRRNPATAAAAAAAANRSGGEGRRDQKQGGQPGRSGQPVSQPKTDGGESQLAQKVASMPRKRRAKTVASPNLTAKDGDGMRLRRGDLGLGMGDWWKEKGTGMG